MKGQPAVQPLGELELFRDPGLDESAKEGPASGIHAAPGAAPHVLTVSGAKGGVGKTILASNIAIYLATIGRRVVLVDAQGPGGNSHTCLGMDRPSSAAGEARRSLAFDTPISDLQVLPVGLSGFGHQVEHGSRYGSRAALRDFYADLKQLPADWVVVDFGSGSRHSPVNSWLCSDHGVFIATPEPTALENTYQFIRSAFAQHLRESAPDLETRRRIDGHLAEMGGTPSPLDLTRRLEVKGNPLAELVREATDDFRFRLVLNQARLRSDLELGDQMRSAIRRRLGVHTEYLGYVDYDDSVWTCVRTRRPLLIESPGTKASRSIERVARRILSLVTSEGRPRPKLSVPSESHHDLLEVDRGATDEEIRRAYKRAKEIYSADSLCCYGLLDARSGEALRTRLQEAYDVLLDPMRRRPYELSVFPLPPEAEVETSSPPADDERPPPPVITPDTEYTGALLRAVRESQGLELRDVCHRTKIGTNYLRAIEEDDFAALPAPVYVRGFVSEVAKFLQLDSGQVSRTYMRRVQRQPG